LKTPSLLPGKSRLFLRSVSLPAGLVSLRKNKTGQSFTSLQKGQHFPLRPYRPGREVLKIIFAREQKCIINHFGLAFEGEMVVTNTTNALEKFLITVFPLKDFFNSR
jgi:hypothetical protein